MDVDGAPVALVSLAIAAGWKLRTRALTGPVPDLSPADPCLVGWVADGTARAVQTAVVYLRTVGLVTPGGAPFAWTTTCAVTLDGARDAVAVHCDPDQGSGRLITAVLHALPQESSTLHLPANPGVRAALSEVRERAERLGAALSPAHTRAVRRSALPPAAAGLLGLLTLVTQRMQDPEPDRVTALATVAALLAATLLLLRAPTRLPAATQALHGLERRFDRPAPPPSPDDSLPERAMATACAFAVLGGRFEVWAAALFEQPELGRLAVTPAIDPAQGFTTYP